MVGASDLATLGAHGRLSSGPPRESFPSAFLLDWCGALLPMRVLIENGVEHKGQVTQILLISDVLRDGRPRCGGIHAAEGKPLAGGHPSQR